MSRSPLVVVVAGGSASGKSTHCDGLVEWLKERGVGCEVVGVDGGYWKTLESGGPGVYFSYDDAVLLDANHVDVVDREAVLERVKGIDEDVVLVDCHLGLAIEEFREIMDFGVYVDLDDDVRVVRRIKRDMEVSGRGWGGDLEYVTRWYLESARPGHEKFIAPSKKYADLVVRGDEEIVSVVGERILEMQKEKPRFIVDMEQG